MWNWTFLPQRNICMIIIHQWQSTGLCDMFNGVYVSHHNCFFFSVYENDINFILKVTYRIWQSKFYWLPWRGFFCHHFFPIGFMRFAPFRGTKCLCVSLLSPLMPSPSLPTPCLSLPLSLFLPPPHPHLLFPALLSLFASHLISVSPHWVLLCFFLWYHFWMILQFCCMTFVGKRQKNISFFFFFFYWTVI